MAACQYSIPTGAIRVPEPSSSPALCFDLFERAGRLRDELPYLGGRNAQTLVKYPDLRVVLVTVKAGTRLVEHRAAGSISVQTLSGQIRIHAGGRTFELPAGSVLALERSVSHDVEAVADSVFLLTIAWRT